MADLASFVKSCASGDAETVKALLAQYPALISHRDPDTLKSPLHHAASSGSVETVMALVTAGHQWNAVDAQHRTAAEDAGHDHIWDLLLQEGVRTEMILGLLGRRSMDCDDDGQSDGGGTEKPSNATYLNSKLVFSEGRLVDEEANGVMMGWERPLMEKHADVIAPTEGLDVLNVGFGLGIIDTLLQERRPKSHTIIEAHPDVYKKMIEDGWDKKEGVRVLFGRWQDVLGELETYDGIFFDTFGEFYEDLRQFHEALPNILRETGTYSYFNGLAGGNPFFHAVSCAVAEADLEEIGLSTTTEEIEMDELGDEVWRGIRRRYWQLDKYRVPICRFAL